MFAIVMFMFLIVIVQIAFGATGSWISTLTGRGALSGFLLGFFLSGIGLLVAALLPRSIEHQARERLAIEHAIEYYKETGKFPSANQLSTVEVPTVEWIPKDTRTFNNLVAVNRETVDFQDLLTALTPTDLPKHTRQVLRLPLDHLYLLMGPKEVVQRVAEAITGNMRGLLVVTNQRFLFLDEITGTVELVFAIREIMVLVLENGFLIQVSDGAFIFKYVSPTSLPAFQHADVVASENTVVRPRLRVCPDCNAEFTHVFASDLCIDCGGVLRPVT